MAALRSMPLFLLLVSTLLHGQPGRPAFDASRLRIGSFHYQTIVNGKTAGQSTIQVRRLGQSAGYRYSNAIAGAFSQSWEAVASETFDPVSARLAFGEGADARPSFELAYRDGRVTGFAFSRDQPPVRREVDEAVPPDVVDQRIDWAAIMALDQYVEGRELVFHVFDPGTGLSRVLVRTAGRRQRVSRLVRSRPCA